MKAHSNKLQVLSILLYVTLIGGCAAYNTELKNAEGEVSTCQNIGWGWLGAPIAMLNQHRCESELRSRGYTMENSPNIHPEQKPASPEIVGTKPASDSISAPPRQISAKTKLPSNWSSISIPVTNARNGAIFWAKRQEPDAYLALSKLPPIDGSTAEERLKKELQENVLKLTSPKLSPVSDFKISNISGHVADVSGIPINAKEPVRFKTFIFLKNSEIYRLEIFQPESAYFSTRIEVAEIVENILGDLE
jgi:hypothetical protein